MIEFSLREPLESEEAFIELNKLLKATQFAESGSMSNQLITEGKILVNGKVDTRKRAKIRRGDQVSYNSNTIKVI